MVDDPDERPTENREVFRRANQELDASASQMGLTGPRPYLCERSDTRCTRTMMIDGGSTPTSAPTRTGSSSSPATRKSSTSWRTASTTSSSSANC